MSGEGSDGRLFCNMSDMISFCANGVTKRERFLEWKYIHLDNAKDSFQTTGSSCRLSRSVSVARNDYECCYSSLDKLSLP